MNQDLLIKVNNNFSNATTYSKVFSTSSVIDFLSFNKLSVNILFTCFVCLNTNQISLASSLQSITSIDLSIDYISQIDDDSYYSYQALLSLIDNSNLTKKQQEQNDPTLIQAQAPVIDILVALAELIYRGPVNNSLLHLSSSFNGKFGRIYSKDRLQMQFAFCHQNSKFEDDEWLYQEISNDKSKLCFNPFLDISGNPYIFNQKQITNLHQLSDIKNIDRFLHYSEEQRQNIAEKIILIGAFLSIATLLVFKTGIYNKLTVLKSVLGIFVGILAIDKIFYRSERFNQRQQLIDKIGYVPSSISKSKNRLFTQHSNQRFNSEFVSNNFNKIFNTHYTNHQSSQIHKNQLTEDAEFFIENLNDLSFEHLSQAAGFFHNVSELLIITDVIEPYDIWYALSVINSKFDQGNVETNF